MNIKKIISIGLCTFTISTSSVLPAFAAKSADPNNSQIVIKVEQFNKSKLGKLNQYITQINTRSSITKYLITLYQKLDNLAVYDINIANEINESTRNYLSTSIGSQLECLFSFLNIISCEYNQDTPTAEMRAQKIIDNLINRLQQIDISKNSEKLSFKSRQEKIDHMSTYLHAIIPYSQQDIGIKLTNEFNKTFADQNYKDDRERVDHIIAYLHYIIPYNIKELGIKIANEFNVTFA